VKSFVEPVGGHSAEPFHISQVALTEKLEVRQPTISKIERHEDMNLSTLRQYVRAGGGEPQVTARFPYACGVEIGAKPKRRKHAARAAA
jgi:demethoxyubiquinone hydroxylase (CLK1/Coq7/Cat5 family)